MNNSYSDLEISIKEFYYLFVTIFSCSTEKSIDINRSPLPIFSANSYNYEIVGFYPNYSNFPCTLFKVETMFDYNY